MRLPTALVVVCLALLEAGQAWKLDEWMGLRIPKKNRELQETVFDLCATAFTGPKSHLLTNLNKNGKALANWVPVPDENFLVRVDLGAGTLTLDGRVIPKGEDNLDNVLNIDFTYSNPIGFTDCYCASEEFLGDLTNIDYNRIEKRCTLQNYWDRPDTNEDQFFCPTCQENQCEVAAGNPSSPDPIYADWIFYTEVDGGLTGPGLELFRDYIEQGFKSYDIDENIDACTPDFTNLPLPQLGCSNFEEPEEGLGFGANSKNQECGFSTWFNCAEDLPALGGDNVQVHVADINLDIITCPMLPQSPEPTPQVIIPPTLSPTTSPTDFPSVMPTTSPTPFPTDSPTDSPTVSPTVSPTSSPTESPTEFPTEFPTQSPTSSPTESPTNFPSVLPTVSPTQSPTDFPTVSPSLSPTVSPTGGPTTSPTEGPTQFPTDFPTVSPTLSPTESPTNFPTNSPTESPTNFPTVSPTDSPTLSPTNSPTNLPTDSPTDAPTLSPTPCPRPKCKKIKVCVPCKYFPDDETCGDDMTDEDWLDWIQ